MSDQTEKLAAHLLEKAAPSRAALSSDHCFKVSLATGHT